MVRSSKPLSALAALLFLSDSVAVDAFSIGSASSRREIIATRLNLSGGGMDAYDAQMAAATGTPAAPTTEQVAGDMLDSSREQSTAAAAATAPSPSAVALGTGDIDAAGAIAALDASQTLAVAKIASAIPDLARKPDQSYGPAVTPDFTVAGHAVRMDASDAAGPANVAWLSDLCVDGTLSSLTIFNGPLADVPHLISRCVATGGDTLHFFLDFRPRAYGAYDLRDAAGNYPGPETLGRKAFEYSGARKDFDTKFGTEEVVSFLQEETLAKLEGVVVNPGVGDAGLADSEGVTRGPLAMDITMPLSATNVAIILAAREKAASLWLEWALDSGNSHRPGAPVNSQYVYDSKYKINAYGVLLDVYVKLFGQSEGEKLAAADSGPIDEGYVGGGS